MIYKNQVLRVAIYSRLLIFILQYVFNYLIEDHEAGVFQYTTDVQESPGDKIVWHLFSGFLRWDGHYYMHIAKNGYTYENTIAFLPLFPVTVRLIGEFISNFVTFLNIDSILLIVFTVFNSFLFVKTAVILYQLTEIILYPSIAFKAAVLFSFNPASIFFSATYSETLFAYLTFKGMLNCLRFYGKYSDKNSDTDFMDIVYIIPFSLSTCTRSNGVLNVGFFLYTLGCLFIKNFPVSTIKRAIFTVKYIFLFILYTVITIWPFLLYQQFCFDTFCTNFTSELPNHVTNYAIKKNYVLQGQNHKYNQTWCQDDIPLAYSYVQKHYWNVGFLKYYEPKQIPNFLLATPIITIVLTNAIKFIYKNFTVKIFTFNRIYETKKTLNIFHEPSIYVFVIHAFTFTLFCLFCVHVQVSTRMICSSTPFFYWICAHYLENTNFTKNIVREFLFGKYSTWIEKLIRLYFILYFIVGTALFSNFLPFT